MYWLELSIDLIIQSPVVIIQGSNLIDRLVASHNVLIPQLTFWNTDTETCY